VNDIVAYLQEGNVKRAALLFDHICVVYDPRRWGISDTHSLSMQLPSLDTMYEKYGLIYSQMTGWFTSSCGLDYKNNSIIILDDDFLIPDDIEPFSSPCHGAYTAALNSIPQIVESECSWEQVWEVRKDSDAKRKLRKLRGWFYETMQSTSISHAQGIIESRIDDYKWAVEKHGLVTAIGALKTVVKPGAILSASGAAIAGNLVAGPTVAAFTAGIALTSNVTVEIANYLVNKKDIGYGKSSEVAILFDIQNELAKENKSPNKSN